jgi:hypothetical protein
MATINIRNAPANLDMESFKVVSDGFGALAKSARYVVRILPTGLNSPLVNYYGNGFLKELIYLCEVAEFPGRGFINIDNVRYYGPSFKMPVQSSYEDITLTFLCRQQSLERQFFDDWMDMINPINTYDFNYRDDYGCQIDIFQYSEYASINGVDSDPIYMFSLKQAWPVLVNPQPITWADDQFLRLGVTFTYYKWERPGLDPTPSVGADGSYSFVTTDL